MAFLQKSSGALTVVVICITLHGAWSCAKTLPSYGNMSLDQELEVGSTLIVKCTLNSSSVPDNITSQNLAIKFGSKYLSLIILDSYSVKYEKENSTVNDSGFYNCYIITTEMHYVCSSHISVGYPPLPVKNFSCISYSFINLNCSWQEPENKVPTKYAIYDIISFNKNWQNSNSDARRRCPHPTTTFCVWSISSTPNYRYSSDILKFVMTANNSLGYEEELFSFNHTNIVIPGQIDKLQILNVTKTGADVIWLKPDGFKYGEFAPGLFCEINYCPLWDMYQELCGIVTTQNKTSAKLTNLLPHITYEMQLRCRLNVEGSEDNWGKSTITSFQTFSDVPSLAPEVTSSSFEVHNLASYRKIELFWKPIPSKFEYGGNFSYQISYHHYYLHPRLKRQNSNVHVKNKTSYSFNLQLDQAYIFKIFAVNEVNSSLNSSIIIVDKASNMLETSNIYVLSYDDGRYTISWSKTVNDSNQYFILYWCRGISLKCYGPINWKITNESTEELVLYDDNVNSYQFAVAVHFNERTSGMAWAECIVHYNEELSDLIIDASAKNATSIEIQWRFGCDAQKNLVQEYRINYCILVHSICLGNVSYVSFSSSIYKEKYIISGLKPFTDYKFAMQARKLKDWNQNSYPLYKTTLSTAPANPPKNVQTVLIDDSHVKVKFFPPETPNGIITKYIIYYKKVSSSAGNYQEKDVNHTKANAFYEIEIKNDLHYYTNYSIQVKACVQRDCSTYSKPVIICTGISTPSKMEPPSVHSINKSAISVTWKSPDSPNGPIDIYRVIMSDKDNKSKIYNVSDVSLTINMDCPEEEEEEVSDNFRYNFSIQAINLKDDKWLIGSLSEPSIERLCYSGLNGISKQILGGLIAGISCGLILVVLIIYGLAKWMKKKVDMVKNISVILPSGLDSPIENPLSSYDKFKSGLQTNRDSGIPTEHTYERLCSYASNKSSKDMENFLEASSEEFLNSKSNREKSGRNQSGDSNTSGKCHDSISSNNTNKTHLSIDSGAEMDLPQSPDGQFSDTSSSNTTPRSYKPDLEIVEENHVSSSKDSGLDKDGFNRSSPNIKTISEINGFPCYIRKKNHPYFNVQMLKKNGQIQPYSKFAVIAPAFTPKYVTYGVHNVTLLDQQSLANSEPSVADAQDDDDDSEPLVSGVPPYCRFGLARSAGTGINILNQTTQVQPNLGYSKFGIIYSTIDQQDNENSKMSPTNCIPNYMKVARSNIIQNQFAQKLFITAPVAMKSLPDAMIYKPTNNKTDSELKFPERKTANKGYVSFNQALGTSSLNKGHEAMPCTILPIQESEEKNLYNIKKSDSNGAIAEGKNNQVSLPQVKGYVSFQDAKVMSQSGSLLENSNNSNYEDVTDLCNDLANSQHKNFPTVIDSETPVKSACDIVPSKFEKNLDLNIPIDTSLDFQNSQALYDDDLSENEDVIQKLNDETPLCNGIGTKVQHETKKDTEYSSCRRGSLEEFLVQPQRTVVENPKETKKSNGYVPWTELFEADKISSQVSTFPSGTNDLDIAMKTVH